MVWRLETQTEVNIATTSHKHPFSFKTTKVRMDKSLFIGDHSTHGG